MKTLRIISLCALAIAILVSVDIGLNYLNSTFHEVKDGISCISLFKPFFGDNNWTVYNFFHAFSISLWISCALAIENMVLTCIHICKNN